MGLLSTIGAASGRAYGFTRSVISAAIKDAYFNLTTLLLPGNGTNGAQNNTFLDSSSNNFTITRNGNTTQGTFTPFSQTGWSNFFGGDGGTTANSNQFYFADNAALELGSSDFCIESWIYLTATPTTSVRICDKDATSNTSYLFYINATNNPAFNFSTNGSAVTTLTSTGTVSRNAWNHVAITRSGSTFTFWINGVSSGTSTNAVTLFNGTAVLRIGNAGSNDRCFPGYISNFRLVTGSAVYTTGFTPSTTPLTAITGTQILTCQSNRFVDNSSNAFAITVTGTPSVQSFSPFAPTAAYSTTTVGGSGYFDGSGDFLTAAAATNLNLGSGDFTVECWVYPTVAPGAAKSFLSQSSVSSPSNGWALGFNGTSNNIWWYSNGAAVINSTSGLQLNSWNYVAAVRSGTTLTLYINGASVGTATNSTNYGGTSSFYVGSDQFSQAFTGYISGSRIVKGTALSISVPTTPPTAITNTQLLLNFTNAGITDATAKNDLETVGNAQISTTQSKWGGGSMSFNGTTDYLVLPSTPSFGMGTGDFTIEFWLYLNANGVAGGTSILDFRSASGASPWTVYVKNGGGGNFIGSYTSYGASGVEAQSGAISLNSWTYISITRANSTWRIFINGTSQTLTGSGYDGNLGSSNKLTIGAAVNGTSLLNAYIDDLRITKGYARYTANFTPPTSAFALQ